MKIIDWKKVDKLRQIIYWKKSGQTSPVLEIIHWKKVDEHRHFQKKENVSMEKKMYFAILNGSPKKQHTIPADVLPNDSEDLLSHSSPSSPPNKRKQVLTIVR